MYNLQLFNQIIPRYAHWTRQQGGFKVEVISVSSVTSEIFVSDKELADIHPLLPKGLTFYVEDDPVRSDYEIKAILRVWDSSLIVKKEHDDPVAFTNIDYVHLGMEDLYIDGSGYAITTRIVPDTGETLMLPAGVVEQVTLFRMWLNDEYPGWEKRYNIANDLGVSHDILLKSIFEVPPEYKTEMPPEDISPN